MAPKPKQPACPVCGRPRVVDFRPFCSKRCSDIDLGRWFNESYVVPEPLDEEPIDIQEQDDDKTVH
jgi:endogenous inhibitor of DNA gyrase (YacG/DUF329 family)